MDEENLLLSEWHERLITMNMQQAVEALAYWVEALEKNTFPLSLQTKILTLIVHITRHCNVLSDNEST